MKIAFYKGWDHGTFVDRVVCLATVSAYSHCELVFSDGICASATLRDGGVRFKHIDLNSGHWDVYDLRIRDTDEEFIRAFFNLHEGAGYDLVGALGSWINLPLGSTTKYFCSEICSSVLDLDSVCSPGSLFQTLIDTRMI